jgi:hypothetical protein
MTWLIGKFVFLNELGQALVAWPLLFLFCFYYSEMGKTHPPTFKTKHSFYYV